LGGYALNESVLACVGPLKEYVFGQTYFGFWMNRVPTVYEAGYLVVSFISAVGESMVIGSTKAGVELRHPQLRVTEEAAYSAGRNCDYRQLYTQRVGVNIPGWVALRWADWAPVRLAKLYITPPYPIAGLPISPYLGRCLLK